MFPYTFDHSIRSTNTYENHKNFLWVTSLVMDLITPIDWSALGTYIITTMQYHI